MRNIVIAPLPKTYHQPKGPSIARGTGCRIIGISVSLNPRRTSHQWPIFLSQLNMCGAFSAARRACRQRILQRRVMRSLDLELSILDAPIAVKQSSRRRTGSALTIGVINAAVTGTHE